MAPLTTAVAHRELLFQRKGDSNKLKLLVRIGVPRVVDRTSTGVRLDSGSAVCTISFEGLDIPEIEVHGADTLHALAQAVEIDKYLRGVTKGMELFWPSGEPYFD